MPGSLAGGADMRGAVAGGGPGLLLSTRRPGAFGPKNVAPRRGLEREPFGPYALEPTRTRFSVALLVGSLLPYRPSENMRKREPGEDTHSRCQQGNHRGVVR